MKVAVIGAGVVGASVAFRLAEAGASVTVLEAGRVGGGTSGCSFAWTNSHAGSVPPEYHALRVASMALYPQLKQQFGDAPWFHQTGNIEWGRPETEDNARRLRERGYKVEWIGPGRVLELEPGIDSQAIGQAPAVFFADDGWVDPVAYADDLLRAAQRRGATLQTGTRVRGIETVNGRATGLRLADGSTLAADTVVNCAGRWAREVAEEPGLQIPLAPTVGFLVFTPPVATGIKRPVHPPGVNLRPDGAGRMMLQSTDVEPSLTIEATLSPSMPQAQEVMRRAARVMPALQGVAAEAVRVAIRPIPADGLPAVGRVPRMDGYYLAVTHSGVTLSPILGKLVADEVVHGAERAELATFRPTRFFN